MNGFLERKGGIGARGDLMKVLKRRVWGVGKYITRLTFVQVLLSELSQLIHVGCFTSQRSFHQLHASSEKGSC